MDELGSARIDRHERLTVEARPGRRLGLLATTVAVVGAALVSLVGCSGTGATLARQAATSTVSGATASAANGTTTSTTMSAMGRNVYAHAGAGMLNDVARRARPLVYVPDHTSNGVDVIDPKTFRSSSASRYRPARSTSSRPGT